MYEPAGTSSPPHQYELLMPDAGFSLLGIAAPVDRPCPWRGWLEQVSASVHADCGPSGLLGPGGAAFPGRGCRDGRGLAGGVAVGHAPFKVRSTE